VGTPARRKLLVQIRRLLRGRRYSHRTEEAYVAWIRRYLEFYGWRHPARLGKEDVARFLSRLAMERRVSAATQNQAACALMFLYREALALPESWPGGVVRAKTPKRLPVVLTRPEVRVTMLPQSLRRALDEHLSRVRELHRADLARGVGRVALPDASSEPHDLREQWRLLRPGAEAPHLVLLNQGVE
jgi:hypothetical protein